MMLDTPIIVIVSGEGGSGGALGIAVGDRVLMQEYAIYSVIPPEGLRRDPVARSGEESRGGRGAQADGAGSAEGRHHRRDHPRADRRRAHRSRGRGRDWSTRCSRALLAEVSALDSEARLATRYDKFRNMGRLGD